MNYIVAVLVYTLFILYILRLVDNTGRIASQGTSKERIGLIFSIVLMIGALIFNIGYTASFGFNITPKSSPEWILDIASFCIVFIGMVINQWICAQIQARLNKEKEERKSSRVTF